MTTKYTEILAQIDAINPTQYAQTRNYLNGRVTYLSPYISRGVISTKQVLEAVIKKGFKIEEITKFVQELAWREYFQRVWQHLGEAITQDTKHPQTQVQHYQIPKAILTQNTGIDVIDNQIGHLYQRGYLHNHIRMYLASLVCNIGKSHWQLPAKWLYYHLLDADWASNTCSWQWVAGAFSNKKYYANQENINKYTHTHQQGTFLDTSYEALSGLAVPATLQELSDFEFNTVLPQQKSITISPEKPIFLYNIYNLDPIWHKSIEGNRILLLEPSHFQKYPVCERTLNFILEISQNIEHIQCFVGEFSELVQIYSLDSKYIFFKRNPAFSHYQGNMQEIDYIFPETTDYYNSFFSFWNKSEKYLKKTYV